MLPLAYFGIESSGLNLAVDLLLLFVVVLYLSLIYWTYADARRRIADPVMVGCATAASFFPFVGTIIYMILRPPEYLEDVHERELEVQAAEARLHQIDQSLCPYCDYRIERDFLRCPSCLRKLKERCTSCSRPLDQAWTICPYCEAEVPGIAPKRTRRRRSKPGALEAEFSELDGAVATEEPEKALDKSLETSLEKSLEETPIEVSGDQDASAVAPEPAVRPRGTGRARRPRQTS